MSDRKQVVAAIPETGWVVAHAFNGWLKLEFGDTEALNLRFGRSGKLLTATHYDFVGDSGIRSLPHGGILADALSIINRTEPK